MSKEKTLRRSRIFITVLLSLFIFQSLWNVAAAYCGHESTSQQSISVGHFGHHVPTKTESASTHADILNQNTTDLPMLLSLQDHHDHLPSCFHVVVTEAQQQLDEPILRVHKAEQKYYWSNSYQSPHLSGLNPPPVLTPL
ncbi:cation efflux protein, CzcI-like [Acinetobacter haemolyticus]|uniref:cation efflux protein, CzcI-like n=1 Tax=Acinetobacter haemolyticus TaxID=29430 RepID=UPI0034CD2E6C